MQRKMSNRSEKRISPMLMGIWAAGVNSYSQINDMLPYDAIRTTQDLGLHFNELPEVRRK
jgi:hypothetical protein